MVAPDASAPLLDAPAVKAGCGESSPSCHEAACGAEQESARAVLRRVFLPIIAPGVLQGKSVSVVTAMLPIFVVVDLHGSASAVGLVASAFAMASLLCGAPMGGLLRNVPYSVSACCALSVLICTAAISYIAQSIAVFFVVRLVGGSAMTVWDMSRKAYASAEVPKHVMGRISAAIAGGSKLARAFAALLTGVVAQYSSNRSIFLVQIGFTGTALLLLLLHEGRQSGSSALFRPARRGSGAVADGSGPGVLAVLRETWRDLAGAGIFCGLVTGIRSSFEVLVPLHGHHVGILKSQIGTAIAAQRIVEAAFTLSVTGHLADSYGRKLSSLPALIVMAAAIALLPISRDFTTFLLASMLYGVANGLLGGINTSFTVGLAPPHARTQFIGLFKTITATGGIVLPPALGLIADWASLEAAAMAISAATLFSAFWLAAVVSEPRLGACVVPATSALAL